MAPASTTPPAYPTHLQHTLSSHLGPVNVVRYNTGARYLLSGGSDRTIRLWNPSTGKEIKKYESGGAGHGREILGLDIAHDNAKFASCGGDKTVFVWDVSQGTIIRKMQGHFGKVNCVAFNADAQVLASAGFDAKVMLWDMRASSRDPLQTLKEASNSITSLLIPSSLSDPSLPPTSHEIISTSLDGHIRTYDLRVGRITEDLVGSPVLSGEVSKTSPGGTLVSASADGWVRVWDRGNGGLLQSFDMLDSEQGQGGQFQMGKRGRGQVEGRIKVEWGYGDEVVLVGGQNGRVQGWKVLSGKKMPLPRAEPEHRKAITWLEVSPNGKQMITSSADGTIKVWSTTPSNTAGRP